MGNYKKEGNRKERQGKTGDGMGNVKVKGENFYRSAKKVKVLNMFNSGKAQRNAAGKVTKAAVYQSRDTPSARIEPNRKWFGNTRVIAQESLQQFRDAVAAKSADPYSYLLKQNKLPMSLIHDNENTKNGIKQHQAKITVETRPFVETFGPKAQRKRVKLDVGDLGELAGKSEKMHDEFLEKREQAHLLSGNSGPSEEQAGEAPAEDDGALTNAREPIFTKGQSKRIWNELYKVVDSSDVLIQVLDARDPEGTRCRHVEKYLKTEAPHKHLLIVLNKCDLVPTKIAAQWVRLFSKEYPTLAFHSSITNSFGKGSLISLLRQFSILHSNRKQLSVGFIGYPNVGKSSIINTLRKKKVCKTAPIPGETKVWQYITLMKRIYLIDCPGVVPPSPTDTDSDLLLRGVVRVEVVKEPAQYVETMLQKCQRRHVERTYGVKGYVDAVDLLEKLARKGGKLLKGGEADVDSVAKMVLNDFLRGKVPWFVPPKSAEGAASESKDEATASADKVAGESGLAAVTGSKTGDVVRLNKQPTTDLRQQKRKRTEEEDVEEDDDDDGIEEGEGIDVEDSAEEDFSDLDDEDSGVEADGVDEEADGSESFEDAPET